MRVTQFDGCGHRCDLGVCSQGRPDDPWYDVLASGGHRTGAAAAKPVPGPAATGSGGSGRCLLPAGLFLLWYLAYALTVAVAPTVLARPVAGPLNVAMLVGAVQFTATCWVLPAVTGRRSRRPAAVAGLSARQPDAAPERAG